MRSLRAFTLIELLVSIAIIALLVGIALPAMKHVRATSRQAACAANLQQIGVAWTIYHTQDYPQQVPPAVSFPSPIATAPPGEITLIECFGYYLSDPKVWGCPSDDRQYYQTHGTSYEYPIALLLAFPNHAELLAKAFAMPTVVPIVQDAESFHNQAGSGSGVQTVFADGHVAWSVTP